MADNKALMQRFYEEVFNQGNIEAAKELVSPDIKDYESNQHGIEGLEQTLTMFRAAFPDLRMTIDAMIGEGDLVASRGTMRGTHKGEFMGILATGRKIEVPFFDMVRFANGKAIEHWGISDQAAMMTQLGAEKVG